MSKVFLVPLQETAVYILAVVGLYLLLQHLRFPDISMDNVFAFGSLVGAAVLLNDLGQASLWIAVPVTAIAGATIGVFTSSLYALANIPKLLAGIITYSMLFSVNIKIFGKPNVPLLETASSVGMTSIILVDVVVLLGVFIVTRTNLGISIHTSGNNPNLLDEFGAPTRLLLGLGMAGAVSLIAVAGLLGSVYFGFADAGIGIGVLVNSVAAIMLAEHLLIWIDRSYWLVALVAATSIYNFVLYVVISNLSFGFLNYSDYKIVSGFVIIGIFLFSGKRSLPGRGLLE